MKLLPRHPARDERGVVLIWMALFMIAMMFFVALGVDGAKMAATRTQLQNAADAAALAGGSAVDFSSETPRFIEELSRSRAIATANDNWAYTDNENRVLLTEGDITIDQTELTVTVVARRDPGDVTGGVLNYFSHLFTGTSWQPAGATATAKIEPAPTACDSLVPFGAVPPEDGEFEVGCEFEYVLKGASQSQVSPGNFQLLNFPDCPEDQCPEEGGANIRCLVAYGYPCCIDIGCPSEVTTQTGNELGPVRQGLNIRFDRDTDKRESICYQDYTGNGARIVKVPIIDIPGQGHTEVCVRGFSAFFLKRRPIVNGNECQVYAQFIRVIDPGPGGGGGPAEGTLYTLKLVK